MPSIVGHSPDRAGIRRDDRRFVTCVAPQGERLAFSRPVLCLENVSLCPARPATRQAHGIRTREIIRLLGIDIQ